MLCKVSMGMQLVTGFANKHVLDDGHGRRNGKTWAGVQLYVIIKGTFTIFKKYYVPSLVP